MAGEYSRNFSTKTYLGACLSHDPTKFRQAGQTMGVASAPIPTVDKNG